MGLRGVNSTVGLWALLSGGFFWFVVLRDPVLARVVLRVDVLRALLRLPRLGVVAMAYLSGSLHECGPDHDSCRNPVRHFGQ